MAGLLIWTIDLTRRAIPDSLLHLFLSFGICFAGAVPKTVHFQSEDRKTNLVAYLFEPSTSGRHAAIVLLHGSRAGAYSAALLARHTTHSCDAVADRESCSRLASVE